MLIQILLITLLAIMLVMTWRRFRQGIIIIRDALLWSVLWIGAGVVIVLPQTSTTVAHLFGVGRGVDAVIYASVTLLFMLVFKLFLMLDRMDQKLTDLVRKDALRDVLPARSPSESSKSSNDHPSYGSNS